jgi:hypothetical protein
MEISTRSSNQNRAFLVAVKTNNYHRNKTSPKDEKLVQIQAFNLFHVVVVDPFLSKWMHGKLFGTGGLPRSQLGGNVPDHRMRSHRKQLVQLYGILVL